ncbi:Uu.00g000710.m01.CDS01 [Anthostomella pinea]|uniref:Uu.00g000710.m01.CDS01 n=1 Tax=Anthostomella pinea TaxID=933095 RepID=A0AAI8YIG7_9PEZI|nr:Uu.00g000710.m01.CDS01 [Anthostomella pinea]
MDHGLSMVGEKGSLIPLPTPPPRQPLPSYVVAGLERRRQKAEEAEAARKAEEAKVEAAKKAQEALSTANQASKLPATSGLNPLASSFEPGTSGAGGPLLELCGKRRWYYDAPVQLSARGSPDDATYEVFGLHGQEASESVSVTKHGAPGFLPSSSKGRKVQASQETDDDSDDTITQANFASIRPSKQRAINPVSAYLSSSNPVASGSGTGSLLWNAPNSTGARARQDQRKIRRLAKLDRLRKTLASTEHGHDVVKSHAAKAGASSGNNTNDNSVTEGLTKKQKGKAKATDSDLSAEDAASGSSTVTQETQVVAPVTNRQNSASSTTCLRSAPALN